ncbi:amino acid transporter [Asanoa siamensis]|uniref:Amino acid transporter n=1 Tax=Asanoa siamensis TaxID=926357 RepID=A0ABQ4CRI2_9ACTN|nr:amino acid transporter [Asanoa siamensis]GIF73447.1 amino acid transporter [Asanoa siamensis]
MAPEPAADLNRRSRFSEWFLRGAQRRVLPAPGPLPPPREEERKHSWWRVMCLTGLDYFSTLGYQPGIAALAAGVLAPLATIVLVLVTLLGALPVYRRVARESPHGAGSLAMLSKLLSYWQGKLVVLVLLGFAATDFIITMTLSAADATAHIDENPFWPDALRGHDVLITLVLLALLGAVFLKGFAEAIGIAVVVVGVYLTLNVVVVVDGLIRVATHPTLTSDWWTALTTMHGSPFALVGIALIVFPRLALGLSGFETGVAVMPHIKGARGDTERRPVGRIRGAHKLLTTAAVTMSVFLITSSIITTVLIPADAFDPGGAANGRALAFLAHENLGASFGTAYDLSTIFILWFAGASAMAGLLNLVPRYLPRFGMAPNWATAVRPLVVVFTAVAFFITWLFDADVTAQGGAYATGVLVLITSAAIAVTLSSRRRRQRKQTIAFGVISLVFVYTTIDNIVERPDGVKIAGSFIGAMIIISVLSRIRRAFELRFTSVQFDETGQQLLEDCKGTVVRIIANHPDAGDAQEYQAKLRRIVDEDVLPDVHDVMFAEVTITDPSEFESDLRVRGEIRHGRYRVFAMASPNVATALAGLLLEIQRTTGQRPHIYFEWTEGNPASNFLRYLAFGQGEVAPVTREILREHEPDRLKRPHVHVG